MLDMRFDVALGFRSQHLFSDKETIFFFSIEISIILLLLKVFFFLSLRSKNYRIILIIQHLVFLSCLQLISLACFLWYKYLPEKAVLKNGASDFGLHLTTITFLFAVIFLRTFAIKIVDCQIINLWLDVVVSRHVQNC